MKKKIQDQAGNGLLSTSQAGRDLGITRQGVLYLIKRGYLQAVQIGPYRLVPRYSLEAYKKARPRPGLPKGTKLGPRQKKP